MAEARRDAYARKRAERRLGERMRELPKAKGSRGQGRPKKGGSRADPPSGAKPLSDYGIDKHLADRAARARSGCGPSARPGNYWR